jgi:hypothetical protein
VISQSDIDIKDNLNKNKNMLYFGYTDYCEFTYNFGSVILESDKTEALWTWFCGGMCANGLRQNVITNHGSYIPGNWWYHHVNIPTWSYRQPITENNDYLNSLSNFHLCNTSNSKDELNLIKSFVKIDHNIMRLEIIKNIFTTSLNNTVANSLEKYFSSINALLTYDYFTYKKINSSHIAIGSYFDIGKHIFDSECLNIEYIKAKFIDVDTLYKKIQEIYEDSEFVGDKILVNCLREITNITEIFSEYIVKGMNTPELCRKFKNGVNELYFGHKNMIMDIERITAGLSPEIREQINKAVSRETTILNNFGNSNSNLLTDI